MKSVFRSLLLLSASLICLCTALICPALDFNADADVTTLGRLSNADTITNLLTHRSNEQRVAIAQAYKKRYNRDLVDIFKRYKTNYGDLLVAMLTPLSDYYAKELSGDIGSFKPDSNAAVDILTTSSNAFTEDIYKSYMRLYPDNKESLAAQFQPKFKGLCKQMVLSQFQGLRNETEEVNLLVLTIDTEMIYQYGLGPWYGKRDYEENISNIFARRSFKHLHHLINLYEKNYKRDMKDAFLPWKTDFQYGARNMINVLKSVPDYFARRLHDTMVGWGTANSQLIRIIVGRSEVDLDGIKDAFQKRYNKSLYSMIEDDTSDEFHHALLAIVNTKRQICSSQFC